MFRSLTIYFLILLSLGIGNASENSETDSYSNLGEKIEIKLSEYVFNFTKWLEQFNDRTLGKSELGRWLRYDQLKPKVEETARNGKNLKKMSMAMMPMVFHVGATSTWMLLTSIMAAKSVAIGLALLVFKIAVSSAKVASFFTSLKAKHSSHHHDWSWAPPEHGYDRSFRKIAHPSPLEWNSYTPEWTPSNASPQQYKTIPVYNEREVEAYEGRQKTDKKLKN